MTDLTPEVQEAVERLRAYFDPSNPNGKYRDPQHLTDLATILSTLTSQQQEIERLKAESARLHESAMYYADEARKERVKCNEARAEIEQLRKEE